MNALGKLFLKGLAVVIPVALTLAILWWVATGAETLMGAILKFTLPDGWYVPGMGLVSGLGTDCPDRSAFTCPGFSKTI